MKYKSLIAVDASKEVPTKKNTKNDAIACDVLCTVKGYEDKKIVNGSMNFESGNWIIIGIMPTKGVFESSEVIWFKQV